MARGNKKLQGQRGDKCNEAVIQYALDAPGTPGASIWWANEQN
jgi:hypothetical protein